MNKEFEPITSGVYALVNQWEQKLSSLNDKLIVGRKNKQERTIKQIVGHMIDSASNNTHRIIHLQYRESPLHFPNYATNGNNDRWIATQNYDEANWQDMLQLWKYSNLHIIHVIKNVDETKLENQWYYSKKRLISLKEGIIDYLRHLKLHLSEIDELISS